MNSSSLLCFAVFSWRTGHLFTPFAARVYPAVSKFIPDLFSFCSGLGQSESDWGGLRDSSSHRLLPEDLYPHTTQTGPLEFLPGGL